jgi:glycosyltransferase involved in cell wall biosynthesis
VSKTQCVDLAAKLGLLGSGVLFLPPVSEEELSEAARFADVGVIPYKPVSTNYRYCCPNKLSQYARVGLPIMAGNTDYLVEVVAAHEIGLSYEVSSEDSIVATINRFARDHEFRKHCALNSLRFAEEVFHWQKHGKTLYESYAHLLNGTTAQGPAKEEYALR